jgi:hypothetical protein
MYIMALGFGGFLGAGSRTDEEIERRAEADRKREAKRKQDSIEFNKKRKGALQGALGKDVGGAFGEALSFGSAGKGGIAGSLGLGGGGLFGAPKRKKKKTPTREEFMAKVAEFKQYQKTRPVMTTRPVMSTRPVRSPPRAKMLVMGDVIGTPMV